MRWRNESTLFCCSAAATCLSLLHVLQVPHEGCCDIVLWGRVTRHVLGVMPHHRLSCHYMSVMTVKSHHMSQCGCHLTCDIVRVLQWMSILPSSIIICMQYTSSSLNDCLVCLIVQVGNLMCEAQVGICSERGRSHGGTRGWGRCAELGLLYWIISPRSVSPPTHTMGAYLVVHHKLMSVCV